MYVLQCNWDMYYLTINIVVSHIKYYAQGEIYESNGLSWSERYSCRGQT